MKVKIQSEAWFRKYAYQDQDADWWLTKELWEQYNNHTHDEGSERFHFFCAEPYDAVIDLNADDNYYIRNFGEISWCIAEIYTVETNPEMFL